jgi:hypothetical protein
MADPTETTSTSYREVSDQVAGLTGTAISATGDIIDIETGGRLGGRLLGPLGVGADVYFRSIDEDGLTVRDGVSVGGGFLGGVLTGAALGSMGWNPFTAALGGIAGGFAVGFGIDSIPGSDPRGGIVTTVSGNASGGIERQTHQIVGFEWVGGQKVDVLHTTTVVTDAQGNIVSRSQVRTAVTNGFETLDMIRDAYRGKGLVEQCFPASTPITISLTETRPISDIRVGDTVLAFDPAADLGRGALVPRKVVRLYRNTTDEWVKLTWVEGGEAKELIATPGHHFLDRFGNFPTIEEMLQNGRATVVLASGELTEVTAERITYSAQTAHLFEQAQAVGMIAGNAALKPAAIDAWQTYNFEVEDLHTYVAGGVRVHNSSGILGQAGNTIDDALDRILGGTDGDGSVRDKISDTLTAHLHFAGELLSRFDAGKFYRKISPKYSTWRVCNKIAAAVFLCAGLMVKSAHADTEKYFEKWTKSEGFDVGYACNWWKDVPGPESMFQVRKLKSAEILADVDSVEFRMIKPHSAKSTIDSYDGSLFTVRVDREAGSIAAIRVVYSFTRNGSCSFIVKAADSSLIEVLRGSDAPSAAISRKAMKWVGQSIDACHRRLRRAIDPNLLFDCRRSLNPYSTDDEPSEGLRESVMPEGVVPASVARIFIQNRSKTFAVTTYGETIEIRAVGE